MEQDIEEIYKEHAKLVYYYLFSLCKNEFIAEELTQEAFYRAVKTIGSFRNECKIEVWICQIAKNLWFKERQRIKKRVIVHLNEEIGEIWSENNIEEEFIEKEEKEYIYKQIEKLNSPYRELMYLRLKSNMTFKDISKIIGKTETWARHEYYKWKQKIKEEMGEQKLK